MVLQAFLRNVSRVAQKMAKNKVVPAGNAKSPAQAPRQPFAQVWPGKTPSVCVKYFPRAADNHFRFMPAPVRTTKREAAAARRCGMCRRACKKVYSIPVPQPMK
jgi:hypothetical protein